MSLDSASCCLATSLIPEITEYAMVKSISGYRDGVKWPAAGMVGATVGCHKAIWGAVPRHSRFFSPPLPPLRSKKLPRPTSRLIEEH